MHRNVWIVAALAALVGGCATSGYGSGALRSTALKPGESSQVVFAWDAGTNPVSGNISATLPDGRRFEGRFMQITSQGTSTSLGGYGWGPGYSGWYDGWYGAGWGGGTTFAREYSGHVIATLMGPSEERMRCHFVLEDPRSGPAGGGQGDCEISTGERVESAVLSNGD